MLTGRVTGTVARIVAQEGVPQPFASARVTFLARVGEFPAGTDLVIPDRVTCRLDAQGRILDPTDPEGVRLGVELAASENVGGGFSTVVRVEGPSFTTRMFDIIVRSGETIDIATVVRVPPQPGQVVDRLAGLVDQVQEWVDDPDALRGNPGDPGDPGVGVSGAEVTDTGRLIITLTSGQQIDAGRAWAPTRVYLDANRVPYVLTED